jgi:hypothetical protein
LLNKGGKEMLKLEEFLNLLEFSYKINDNKTLSLVDLTGANLSHIEDDEFELDDNLALNLIDRLSNYIYDYFIVDIFEQLKEYNINHNLNHDCNYDDLLLILNEHKSLFERDIEIIEHLDNPELFDISDIGG